MKREKKKLIKNLVWIDLEMSGLDVANDVILEIATMVTDDQLQIVAQGPDLVIHQSDFVLEHMNSWCLKQHAKSGLTQAVKESTVTIAQAEHETLEFLKKFFEPGQAIVCGNSVWNDKIFLQKYMPELYAFFNYRIIDVSSIKELLRRWYPESPHVDFKKDENHRAAGDIIQSINELKQYRTHFFLPPEYTVSHQE